MTEIDERKSTSHVQKIKKLGFKNNLRRIRDNWWDIQNLGLVTFFLFVVFSLLSYFIIVDNEFGEIYFSNLQMQTRIENGFSLFGIAVSGSIGVTLWLINKGTIRWSVLSRVHALHQATFEQLKAASPKEVPLILKTYFNLAEHQYQDMLHCNSRCQSTFEFTLLMKELFLSETSLTEVKLNQVLDNLEFMCLWTRGFAPTSEIT